MLKIKDLHVGIEKKEIINGLSLNVEKGRVHVLMGPNGSGKSTLAQALMGHPSYEVTQGEVLFDNKDLLAMSPEERSHAGLFLSFQYPSEITGVTISSFLRMIYNKKAEIRGEKSLSPVKFRTLLLEKMEILGMNESFMSRYLNEGFSGGEKKRMEMLQMLVLEPKLTILDETDSGLDVDALKTVSKAVNLLSKDKKMSVLLITHYARILKHITPDKVHIISSGQIVKEGGEDLAHTIEVSGYEKFLVKGETKVENKK